MKTPSEMIAYIDAELRGLRSRISARETATQREKLDMLTSMRDFIARAAGAGRASA